MYACLRPLDEQAVLAHVDEYSQILDIAGLVELANALEMPKLLAILHSLAVQQGGALDSDLEEFKHLVDSRSVHQAQRKLMQGRVDIPFVLACLPVLCRASPRYGRAVAAHYHPDIQPWLMRYILLEEGEEQKDATQDDNSNIDVYIEYLRDLVSTHSRCRRDPDLCAEAMKFMCSRAPAATIVFDNDATYKSEVFGRKIPARRSSRVDWRHGPAMMGMLEADTYALDRGMLAERFSMCGYWLGLQHIWIKSDEWHKCLELAIHLDEMNLLVSALTHRGDDDSWRRALLTLHAVRGKDAAKPRYSVNVDGVLTHMGHVLGAKRAIEIMAHRSIKQLVDMASPSIYAWLVESQRLHRRRINTARSMASIAEHQFNRLAGPRSRTTVSSDRPSRIVAKALSNLDPDSKEWRELLTQSMVQDGHDAARDVKLWELYKYMKSKG